MVLEFDRFFDFLAILNRQGMKKNGFLLIMMTIVIVGCENFGSSAFRIRNNSSHIVSVYAEYLLSDTILTIQKPNFFLKIDSEKAREFYDSYVDDVDFERLKKENLTIFIFDQNVLDNYSWDAIQENNMYLKRYECSYQEFHNLNWEISYPPTEEMKNVKMYPPYGE